MRLESLLAANLQCPAQMFVTLSSLERFVLHLGILLAPKLLQERIHLPLVGLTVHIRILLLHTQVTTDTPLLCRVMRIFLYTQREFSFFLLRTTDDLWNHAYIHDAAALGAAFD